MKNKFFFLIIIGLSLFTAGCEKTYSVQEFKENEELRKEWLSRCGLSDNSTNCQNVGLADDQLREEKYDQYINEMQKSRQK